MEETKMTSMQMEKVVATASHAARAKLRRIKKSCFTSQNCKNAMMKSRIKLDTGP